MALLPSSTKIERVMVGDDHPLFREALGALVAELYPGICIDLAENMAEVTERAAAGPAPVLFLLDLVFPGMDPRVSLPELRRQYPMASIVIVSMIETRKRSQLPSRLAPMGSSTRQLPAPN